MKQNSSERVGRRTHRFVAAGLVAACILSLAPSAALAHRGEDHSRTLQWFDTGVEYGTIACLNGDCSDIVLDLHGTGRGNPIGKFTIDSTASSVWTAANGDTVTADVLSEPLDPSDVKCPTDEFPTKAREYFLGGTGRFAGATGSYIATGCLLFYGDPFAPGGAQVQLRFRDVGTITY